MARTPITPLRLDPAVKADWTARAAARGLSLSEFVRREVDRDKLVASAEPVGRSVGRVDTRSAGKQSPVPPGPDRIRGARVPGPQARPFSKEQQAGKAKR